MLIPSLGAASALIGLTAGGVLADSISVSGNAFTVTANKLDGGPFAQYGGLVTGPQNKQQPVAVSVIRSATLSNLCQTVKVGPIQMTLHAGGHGTPVSASNLVVDADQLSGNATFSNIVIGQDAGTLTVPANADPQPIAGTFGESASHVTITSLNQHTWLTTAGTFKLPGLSLGIGGSCP